MDSILTTIKALLGITSEYTHYDAQIIVHINSVFNILKQLGVGPNGGFFISDSSAKWSDYIIDENSDIDIEMVKSYIYMKVKLIFDPPLSGTAAEALKSEIAEFEWRLNVEVDPGE